MGITASTWLLGFILGPFILRRRDVEHGGARDVEYLTISTPSAVAILKPDLVRERPWRTCKDWDGSFRPVTKRSFEGQDPWMLVDMSKFTNEAMNGGLGLYNVAFMEALANAVKSSGPKLESRATSALETQRSKVQTQLEPIVNAFDGIKHIDESENGTVFAANMTSLGSMHELEGVWRRNLDVMDGVFMLEKNSETGEIKLRCPE